MTRATEIIKNMNEMARGVVVVDENLTDVAEYLSNMNIHVIVPKVGLDDQDMKRVHLTRRIFITNNSKHFTDDAVAYEYGIIATERVKSKDAKNLATMIHIALVDFSLWSKSYGWLLTLSSSGKHEFKVLPK